ncbi:MAG: hypothetical protein IJG37_06345 [Synergistaceae bacterium]|nr:hypothetical protein [Synergistaceae bacterium]
MSCEIMQGGLRFINRNPQRAHYYVVSPEKLRDIDTLEDLERINICREH